MTRRINTTRVVQIGIVLEVIGLVIIAFVVAPGHHSRRPAPAVRADFGFGIGFANSQLTNVVLSDIHPEKSGVASGANSTVRQVGSALGVAVIGAVFASLTVSRTARRGEAARCPHAARHRGRRGARHRRGLPSPVPRCRPTSTRRRSPRPGDRASPTPYARPLLLAAGFVAVGAFLSLLIPRTPPVDGTTVEPPSRRCVVLEPVEPDPALLLTPDRAPDPR